MQYDYSTECGKNIYHSRTEAEDVKRFRENESWLSLEIYYCENCFGYHLTKNIPNRKKMNNRTYASF